MAGKRVDADFCCRFCLTHDRTLNTLSWDFVQMTWEHM